MQWRGSDLLTRIEHGYRGLCPSGWARYHVHQGPWSRPADPFGPGVL